MWEGGLEGRQVGGDGVCVGREVGGERRANWEENGAQENKRGGDKREKRRDSLAVKLPGPIDYPRQEATTESILAGLI